jgi:23S rRNA pseudouridine1911/1915/1917 synthase
MATKLRADIESKQRLDTFLAGQFPAISRSFLQKLCSNDQVEVNGVPQKSGFKISPDDTIDVLYDMASIEKIEDIDLPILFQNDDIVVINKPAGVISHARGRYWNEPSVASFVRQLTGQEGERAGIVHRLDRATSGVMICAKTTAVMQHLQAQFAARTVQKTYTAVVEGVMDPAEAVIDMPIERNPKAPSTFRVGANGKAAQTEYHVEKSSEHYAQLRLLPKTGRTHQLRVHLKYRGHPIIGDVLYGGKEARRLFLHASALELELPDGLRQRFEAPLPPEFTELLEHDR